MTEDLFALAAELRRRGEPFALATVVRCERPTSAKPGAKALVRPDGTVSGWIGGACAEPVVVREALNSLRDGRPRFIGLIGDGGTGPGRTEGILEYAMTCHSDGTLEIYVEPFLPKPLLVLVGHGPVVEALAALGRDADYSIKVVPVNAAADALDELGLTARGSVVVATHGDLDEEAVARALGTEAGYVSLVASRKRAAVIAERLRRRGVPPERLDRLKAPAGLDIGAVTPEEVAVSILAEIIQRQRAEKTPLGPMERAPMGSADGEATDPVCGMLVARDTARYRSDASGQTVYFCCLQCKETFDRDPQKYAAALGS